MSNTRIPSPSRSLGGIRTPRRYIKRGLRSVGSPARSNASGRLTAILNMNKNLSLALSPLPSRRSVLADSTYIQEPRRKSWWREIDDNTENVLDVLESVATENTNNDIEELIDMEVLSQEKNNLLDLPESSDSESINSIVLPERKLFTQKEVPLRKKISQIIGNRESLAKLQKNNCGDDEKVITGTRDLFQNRKQRTKPVFPAALLSVTPNKTKDDIEINTEASKIQVRNIFNTRPPSKRKNMFAKFIITESEDEITEIQPKVFEFHKNVSISQRLRNRSHTPSYTTDTEMDDWIHLPSSTMQIEDEIAVTPQKKSRLSKLSEAKESNKSLKNVSINSAKTTSNKKANKNYSNTFESNESPTKLTKTVNLSQNQSQQLMSSRNNISKHKITNDNISNNQTIPKTATEVSSNTNNNFNMEDQNEPKVVVNTIDQPKNATEVHKDNNQSIQKPATELSSNPNSDISMEALNKLAVVKTIDHSKSVELEDEANDNNFTLQYENDDKHSAVMSNELNEMHNESNTPKSSPREFRKMQRNKEGQNETLEFNIDRNSIGCTENSKSIVNEEFQIQDEQGEESQIEDGFNLVDSEKSQNNSAQKDDENTLTDQANKNVEKESKDDTDNIENSLQAQNNSDEIEIGENEEDEDDIVHDSDVDECDIEENEPDNECEDNEDGANESFNSENQSTDDNEEVEQADDDEVEEDESDNGTDRADAFTKSPESILHDRSNEIDSFIGGHNSTRKTKSVILKSPHIQHSMAKAQDVTEFSEGTKNSSAENSHWDSHRTTRKTLRQTLGKDFTLRKSLRTLVMEKSVKRHTVQMENAENPQANSTEFSEITNNQNYIDGEDSIEQSVHEISKRTRQATLEMCFQKMKQKNMEQRLKIEEAVRNSFKQPSGDDHLFKVPRKLVPWKRHPPVKPTRNNSRTKQMKLLIPCENLPPEMLEDLKYKPPKRFKPSNASWITARLYKFLENKLEAKYDYKARMRAEKLVETLYDFTKNIRRYEVAPDACVQVLKLELARLDIVKTHFDFYNLFHEFMPREIRIKVVPDVVNKISLPKHGIFSDIIRA